MADFAPVSEVAISYTVLAVSSDFPARTLKDVVALVKANRASIRMARGMAPAPPGHILGELFKREAGLDMTHVAYKGRRAAGDGPGRRSRQGRPGAGGGRHGHVAAARAERSSLSHWPAPSARRCCPTYRRSRGRLQGLSSPMRGWA
ncbi:tripartite tricarboxylate transporter substrate-binding protein [Cupriavidus basilensis]